MGSAIAAPRLWSTGSAVVMHRLSYSVACRVFPYQGSDYVSELANGFFTRATREALTLRTFEWHRIQGEKKTEVEIRTPGWMLNLSWLLTTWVSLCYFTSMWDECNCVVVWEFFGIVFLWDWNENWPFPVLWPLLSFPNLLAYWVQHFHSIIF